MAKQEPPWEEVRPTDWVDWFPSAEDIKQARRGTDEDLDAVLRDARKDPAWVKAQRWIKRNRPSAT